jgi:hypothetical protein
MSPIATVVDWHALLETVGASFAAGLGVTFAFSLAIYGATRFVDLNQGERRLAATAAGALSVLMVLACVGAVVLGIVVMTSK